MSNDDLFNILWRITDLAKLLHKQLPCLLCFHSGIDQCQPIAGDHVHMHIADRKRRRHRDPIHSFFVHCVPFFPKVHEPSRSNRFIMQNE
ncbi:hypothetical protein LR69_02388 [Geobacillus sp. BCO2]|nr:hypothetical protein LR69_02388 [Geobacillus sp. BCO2]